MLLDIVLLLGCQTDEVNMIFIEDAEQIFDLFKLSFRNVATSQVPILIVLDLFDLNVLSYSLLFALIW